MVKHDEEDTKLLMVDATLYLDVNYSEIPPIIIQVDALKVVKFEGLDARYMALDDIIQWHEQEIICGDGDEFVLESLKQIRRNAVESDGDKYE